MSEKAPNPSGNDPTVDYPPPQVAEILDQYLNDLQNGRACSREDLLKKHPDLKDELADYLGGIDLVAGLGVGDDLLDQQLGDFEIVRPIGCGAMGVVYLADQTSLKRQVALKVLRYTAVGEQATKRFEREAELVATLRHEHIVPIYTTGQQDGTHYIAMRLIGGESLSQWSASDDVNRDPKTIARWGGQVARALAHAHSRDIIHRDVKPSNLLIEQDEQDHIWLSDFGLARRYDDLRMSMTGAMLGTPNYMSPEQAAPARHPTDHRSDIYSLGATLFELLTGRCVFLADTPHAVLAQVIAEEAPPLREILPEASRDLETILLKCLEKEPNSRYQTADQLADDLESYAGDRSIKARRPSLVERFSRWKRKNQKSVAWALNAAIAAVVLICVSVAGWTGWNNLQFGELTIQSEEGPIVGRLIDSEGKPTPVFTIPTERPMPVKEGRYTLQTWASGKLGVNQDLLIDRSEVTEVESRMFDDMVFPERTVKGVPSLLPLADRDDLIFFHNQGLTRVDGRSGKDRWTVQADDFVKAVNSETKNDSKAEKTSKPNSTRELTWRFDGLRSYDHNRLPMVAHGFPDINADGEPEVMVANRSHPSLIVFDGETGELLWHYVATPTNQKGKLPYSGTLHMPRDLGDIDGDGIADFAICFRSGKLVQQWLDVVSGKTGKRIWRKQLPTKLVSNGSYNLSVFCQLDEQGFSQTRASNNSGRYRDRVGYEQSRVQKVVAWPPMTMAGTNRDKELLLVCGSKLIICDAKTGRASDFNQGKTLELGFVPAIEPKLVSSELGNEKLIGVLLCEIVSVPKESTGTKPVTRFSMRSLETGKELWGYDAACDLNWTGIKPDWPLVADLTGDAVPEILIGDGADLEKDVHQGASCQGALQVLDAKTGEPRWSTNDVAKIRCMDRQVQRLVIGPDADGDLIDDVYAVSTMYERATETDASVYVDILSAVSGKRIRTNKSEVPVFANGSHEVDLERPFFLGVGPDGHPRLVVATMRAGAGRARRQSTVFISTGTGEVTNVGDGLEYPLQADGDGDGDRDLFLIKPSSRSIINGSGQLVSIKSYGGREQRFAKGQYLRIDDIDRDGVRDLLNQNTWYTVSGATGRRLYRWAFTPAEEHRIKILDGDVDGDEVRDFLVADSSKQGNEIQILWTLVSGRTGQIVWQYQEGSSTPSVSDFSVSCEDMNGDGASDLVLLHGVSKLRDLFRVVCLDGRSGDRYWESELGQMDFIHSARSPVHIADADGDGRPDVLCRRFDLNGPQGMVALNGRSGDLLWKQPNISTKIDHSFLERSKVLPMGSGKQMQLVTATVIDNGNVRISFSDLESGQQTSTVVTKGRFKSHSFSLGGSLGAWNGIPFAASADEVGYAGVCILDPSTKVIQLVVFDSRGKKAAVVQQVNIPKLSSRKSKQNFLIADSNGDGRTDVVFHDGSELVAIDLISNEEIDRAPMPAGSPELLPVDFDPTLLQLITNEGKTLRAGEVNQLKLMDMKTFEVLWKLNSPPGAFVESLLSAGKPAVENLHSAIPRVLYSGVPGFMRVVASESDYAGKDQEVRRRILQAAATPVSFSLAEFSDPRMVESLPWVQQNRLSRNQLSELVQSLTNLLLIVLGAVLCPFFFLRRMLNQGQWSLSEFLLLPLLFVIPYLVLQLPVEINGDVAPSWWLKVLVSCLLVLPMLGFAALWGRELWRGKWLHWSLLSLAPIAIAFFLGVMMLLGSRLRAGSRYDWYGWYDLGSVNLVFSGVYLIGFVLVTTWLFAFGSGVVRHWWKLIFRNPRLGRE